MKPAKNLSAGNNKLASVPESASKKGLPHSPLSPKPKERHNAKGVRDRSEPMVLRSPPIGESVVRYALPIPSSKTKELIAEDEMIRRITRHLKLVVSSLEETYGYTVEDGEIIVKPKQEDVSLSVGDNMNSFLICCSQFADQLEDSVKEEHNILESLFKWFQRQVNQMEEISKDPSLLEEDMPAPDKTVSLSISQIIKQIHRLDELRNCLKQQSNKHLFRALLSKPARIKENLPKPVENFEAVQEQIEEFLKAHSTEELLDVSINDLQTAPSLGDQLNMMLQIFKKQSDMLERAARDQDILESKYKEIQNDFELLSEEKSLLENELQKLKEPEKKNVHERTKKSVKPEKKKDRGRQEDSEGKVSPTSQPQFNEDWIQTQKTVEALQTENKALQERLKQALQEADRTKLQLDYFLNQGIKFLKNEGKTSMEMDTDKIKIKDEDLKDTPLERATLISSSGVPRSNTLIQENAQISIVQTRRPIEESSEKKTSSPAISDISQILKSQDKSELLKNAKEVSVEDHKSSENQDNLFTVVLSSKENQDSLSVETSPPENQTVTLFISPEENTKANVSEEKLQRESQTHTYPAEGKFEAPYEASSENFQLENKDVSEAEIQRMKQNSSEGENETLFMTVTSPEDMISTSRKQSKTENNEATENENFYSYDEQPDKTLGHEHQESKTEMNAQKIKTPNRERHTINNEVSNENLTIQSQLSTSKVKLQVKKHGTSRGERLTNHDEVPDRNLTLEHQDSEIKQEMQVKKRKTSREEKYQIYDEAPDENLTVKGQGSMPNTQVQLKRQKTSKGEGLNKFSFETQKKNVSLEKLLIDKEVLLSRSQRQNKNPGAFKNENFNDQDLDLMPDVSLPLGDSKSKDHLQIKRNIAQIETLDQDMDESFTLEDLKASSEYIDQIQRSVSHTEKDVDQSHTLRTKYEVASELSATMEDLSELKPTINDIIFQLDLDKVIETDPKQLKDAFGHHLIKSEFKTLPKKIPGIDSEHFGDTLKEQHFLKSEHPTSSKTLSGPSEHPRDASQHFLNSEDIIPSKNILGPSEHSRDASQHFLKSEDIITSKKLLRPSEHSRDASQHFLNSEDIITSKKLLRPSEHSRDASQHFLKSEDIITSKKLLRPSEHSRDASQHFLNSEDIITSKKLLRPSEQSRDASQHFLNSEDIITSKNLLRPSEQSRDASQHFLNSEDIITSKKLLRPSEHSRDASQHFLKSEDIITSKKLLRPSEHSRDASQHFLKSEDIITSKKLLKPSEQSRDASQHFLNSEDIIPSKNLLNPDSEHFSDTLAEYILKDEYFGPSMNLSGPDLEHFRDNLRQYLLKGEHLTTLKNLLETNPEHWRDALKQYLLKSGPIEPTKNLPEPNAEHLTGRKVKKGTSKTLLKNQPVLNAGKSKTKLLTNMLSGVSLHKDRDMSTQNQEDTFNKNTPQSKFPTKVINLSPFKKKVESWQNISPYVPEPLKTFRKSSKNRSSITKTLPLPLPDKLSSGQPKTITVRHTSIELPDSLSVMASNKSPGYKAPSIPARKKSIHPYLREKRKFLAN